MQKNILPYQILPSVYPQNETSEKKYFPVLREKPSQILPQNLLKGATVNFMSI